MSVKQIQRSALVTFSAERMFALVNDIEAYPSFMEGCVSAVVLERSEQKYSRPLRAAKWGSNRPSARNTLTHPNACR